MSFHVSKSIISDLERVIIKEIPSIFKAFDFLRREVFYPVKLLKIGFDIFSRDITKFAILVFLGLIIGAWLTVELNNSGGRIFVPFIFPFVVLLPLIVSMFSAPSSYGFCGVKDDHLKVVFDRLSSSNISCVEQIAPIRSNIQQFENRVKVRIIGLRTFMALCWTGFVYLYSEVSKQMISNSHLPPVNDIIFIAVVFLGVLGLYVAIESYSKANNLLFRSAIIGCNEYEYSISVNEN